MWIRLPDIMLSEKRKFQKNIQDYTVYVSLTNVK